MKNTTTIVIFLILLPVLFLCTNPENTSDPEPSGLDKAHLAKNYCGSCHQYVGPDMLSKSIWKEDVLPAMGHRLGIYKHENQRDSLIANNFKGVTINDTNIFPKKPLLAMEDWNKIVDFYVDRAPDSIPSSHKIPKIHPELKHFVMKEIQYSRPAPLTSLVKILPDQRGLVYGDTKPHVNKLIFLNANLEFDFELNLKTAPVHYYEKLDTILLTTIGKNPFPNDRFDGDLQKIYKENSGATYNKAITILPDLQRPVHVEYADINKNGLEDILVCEFGNHTGKVSWYENHGNSNYTKHVLRNTPGAIHARITDLNKDGYNDIIVLMSQGDEGIFYYENTGSSENDFKGNKIFTEKQLLSFSPLNGSQYFSLWDFNGDGHEDILYVAGDNADKTPILKEYHGLYLYLNDGNQNFELSWFHPQNGAYKAIPGDFDLDGDVDIVSISFFPDYLDSPEESFLYLENKGNLEFTPYSFPEATQGRWMVMDVGDLDGDGDLDIALGSFVYFKAMGDTTGLSTQWLESSPSVIVLENTTR